MHEDEAVSGSWRRIDSWLAAYAPAELALLNPPASGEEIEAAGREIGAELPAGLTASLRWHNGGDAESRLLPAASPLGAAGIRDAWRLRMDLADEDLLAAEPGEEPWWHPHWVPWAQTASGDLLVVDQRPGPGQGRLGRAVHDGCGSFTGSWPGVAAYLSALAEVLYGGGALDGWRLFTTVDQRLWWDRVPDARQLHGSPLTPAPVGIPDEG
ncbi:cell wall assembly regulator SMI1 [Lipingzhangella halophila]|uniref:Cell wall assembly regulator SMI1 n=1 Tax=Lipingzhangella halophila TaxID=1783352 RepID=A0A7W7W3R9_9ACTN|nr:SMI1/KNR4 family protein [Lipingzhangella halophila]MBB4932818.1 cell wall assembly regulator SMI1 [Lipingzhangella halophila]